MSSQLERMQPPLCDGLQNAGDRVNADRSGTPLRHADTGDGHLLKEMRRPNGAGRIVLNGLLKLRMEKRALERLRRFPHGVVDEHTTATDAAVELRGDEAGLPLHKCRVRRPGVEELLNLSGIDLEGIDEDDRTAAAFHL